MTILEILYFIILAVSFTPALLLLLALLYFIGKGAGWLLDHLNEIL